MFRNVIFQHSRPNLVIFQKSELPGIASQLLFETPSFVEVGVLLYFMSGK
jgi:hypothetical protein